MNLNNLKNKKLAFLGFGVENYALIVFLLSKKINCSITICNSEYPLGDERGSELKKFKNISFIYGNEYDKNLNEFDFIFRSPGYPLRKLNSKSLISKISSPMNLFFELCPTKNIIGITGTKGKGTTSSLIYEIIKLHLKTSVLDIKKRKSVFLGGNIGIAPFSFIKKMKKNDFVVLELSSFQLEDLNKSPHISIITNFSREHLAPADPKNPNYHTSLSAYWKAKSNIFLHQKKSDYLILNQALNTRIKKYKTPSKLIFFNKSKLKSNLVGEHNKENIAAATEVAKILKIKKETISKAINNFQGLPHRIELIGEKKGIKFYDDSFATTPESAITALKSFNPGKIILLAGGADKGSDFKQFAKEIKKRVKFLVLLEGVATKRIINELDRIKFNSKNSQLVNSINHAVTLAMKQATSEDIILLSTGCASFGMFKNYKERGNLFKNELEKLI